jgi:hypothetical protein
LEKTVTEEPRADLATATEEWDAVRNIRLSHLITREEVERVRPRPPREPQLSYVTRPNERGAHYPRSRIARFFAALVGTHWGSIISPAAASRQVSLGAAVFCSAVLSALFVTVALLQIWPRGPLLSASTGVLFALTLLLVDRFLIAEPSARHLPSRIARMLPRVVVSVAMGFVVTSAVMTVVFAGEIDQQIQEERTRAAQEAAAAVREDPLEAAQIERLQDQEREVLAAREIARRSVETARERLEGLQAELVAEQSGSGGAGSAGCGPRCRLLQTQIDQEVAELNQLKGILNSEESRSAERLDAIASEVDQLYANVDVRAATVARKIESEEIGFVDRLVALSSFDEGGEVLATRLLLLVLLVGIDLLPVLFKLQRPSSHDLLLLEHERIAEQVVVQREEVAAEMARQLDKIELYLRQQARLEDLPHPDARRREAQAWAEGTTASEVASG